jgi:hypothetical protein
MGAAPKLAIASLLLGCLTLAGCADCFDRLRDAEGFVAPRPHHHHVAVVQHDSSQTALSQCNQALYLKSSGSPEEIRAIEDKCRPVILSQPY